MVYDHYTIIKAGVCMNKKVRRVIFPHTYLKEQARCWKDEKKKHASQVIIYRTTTIHWDLNTLSQTHHQPSRLAVSCWFGCWCGGATSLGFSGAELAVEWRREEQLTPPKVGNIVLPIVRRSVAVVLFTVRNRSPKQGASGLVKHKLGWSCWWSRKSWAKQKLDDSPC